MASDLRIRVAGMQDAAAVTDLLRASYPVLMADFYDPALLQRALPIMTRANPALLSSGRYYLAEDSEGRVVGCGGWSFARPAVGEEQEGLAHIRHFASHPDRLRRGIGRALFARCAEDAAASAVARFEVYASLNAERFYRAVGFERLRAVEVQMAPGLSFPSILMECSFKSL
jgi:N-acetylglutamate synthase-like GNAT family acetyltransferase